VKSVAKIRGNSCNSWLFFTLLVLAACSQNEVQISTTQFAEKMKQSNAIVLDVRTSEEFSTGHLDGALNIDWDSGRFQEDVKQIDPSKTVLVYCRSGRRSGEAVHAMRAMGYNDAYNMSGGILKWRAEGLPVSQ
jgi:rhodanese-related sulfurtransferase